MDLQKNTSSPVDNQVINGEEQRTFTDNTCSYCGATLKEGQMFCVNCGTSANKPFIDSVNSAEKKKPTFNHADKKEVKARFKELIEYLKKKDMITIGGIVSGIISVIFGIIMLTKSVGMYESSSRYGGDAYTGIQNASAQTANNIRLLSEISKFGFAFLLIAIGLIAIFYFFSKLKNQEKI